jgi:hypothetical protein
MIAILERDTGQLKILSGDYSDSNVEVLVRDFGRTAAYLKLDGTTNLIERADNLAATAPENPWAGHGTELSATIIIATLGKTILLHNAVTAALNQTHPNYNVIVVDNDPDSGDTHRILSDLTDPRLSIIPAPTKGLSHARNEGVRAAEGNVIAFTDDDAATDPNWLANLIAAIASTNAGAATGPVFPAELSYPPQRYFEARGGFPKGLEAQLWTFDHAAGGPLYPYATARVGAGVSMAFSKQALADIGEFDTNLGAGTKTNGGEDLDAFARLLRAGYSIAYNPDAVLHHVHRRDLNGLKKQIYGNGTGMAALLTKTIITQPWALAVLISRVPKILRRIAPGSERMAGSGEGAPSILSKLEILGFLAGPVLYFRQMVGRK